MTTTCKRIQELELKYKEFEQQKMVMSQDEILEKLLYFKREIKTLLMQDNCGKCRKRVNSFLNSFSFSMN